MKPYLPSYIPNVGNVYLDSPPIPTFKLTYVNNNKKTNQTNQTDQTNQINKIDETNQINKIYETNRNYKNIINDNNLIEKYAKVLLKSEFNRYLGIDNDYKKILNNGCYYLQNFICEMDDFTYFNKIKNELKDNNIISWSKHQKYENPKFSKTFNEIINIICKYFNVVPVETRLNYYRNGMDWKPYHHDSHAYNNVLKENFTIGVSLGSSRELSFLHDKTGDKFNFPQNNGDVFAFNKEVNRAFMHGVPKKKYQGYSCINDRISIIAWCKDIKN